MALTQQTVDMLDSMEVYDDNELEGFALRVKGFNLAMSLAGTTGPLTPVRCCRTCAWADVKDLAVVDGKLVYTGTDK